MSLYLTPKPEDYTTEAEQHRLEQLKMRQQFYAGLLAEAKTTDELRHLLKMLKRCGKKQEAIR